MTNTWSEEELRKFAHTDELLVSPLLEEGETYRKPTTIWGVVIDDALYVRAYNGQASLWYRAALARKAGRIAAGKVQKDINFERVEGSFNDRIDEAYRAKYGKSSYLAPMVGARARAATMKLVPRDTRVTRSAREKRT